MQNDTWLTDTSHSDRCPLCSQSLPAGAARCPACGFTVHVAARASVSQQDTPISKRANRSTPLPARASAQHIHSLPSTSTSLRHSAHSSPANISHAQAGWQHESPGYKAASSLSALSLIIAEMPTVPPRSTQSRSKQINQPEQIDEIDTTPIPRNVNEPEPDLANAAETPLPPSLVDHQLSVHTFSFPAGNPGSYKQTRPTPYQRPTLFPAFDEIDTLPEPGALGVKDTSSSVAPEATEIVVDATSWHVGPGSPRMRNTRRMASRSQKRRTRLTLLDRARWWLVRPGHIEAVLRLLGGILLFALTFLLAFVIVLNLPGSVRGFFPTSTPSLFEQLAGVDPLVWAIGLCYILAFLLLSIAALLRRRR